MLRALLPKLSGAILGLVIAGMAGLAEAHTVNFSIVSSPFSTELQGVNYSWAGGTITGAIDISPTPFYVSISPDNGEEVSLFDFTGTATLNGVPLTFADYLHPPPGTGTGSAFEVWHNTSDGDAIGFSFVFQPFNVSDNLQLLSVLVQDFDSGFRYVNFNFGSIPRNVVFTPGGSYEYEFSATPIPAALPLFATGLGALGLLGWRRKRRAAALAA